MDPVCPLISGVTWVGSPYKFPKINWFHWGEKTLLIGGIAVRTPFTTGRGPTCKYVCKYLSGKIRAFGFRKKNT